MSNNFRKSKRIAIFLKTHMFENEKDKIQSEEISVVVQGPIYGSSCDKEKYRLTARCLKSIRKYLPNSKIILSTWEGSDVDGLDLDVLVVNKDPGYSSVGFFNKTDSSNRQIISTLSGLKKVVTKYAIKVRSDMIFKGNRFIKYFFEFNRSNFDYNYKLLKQRVLVLSTSNPNKTFPVPFHMCDWFYFGLTEDLIDIFSIPFLENNTLIRGQFTTEQYLWLSFISKHKDVSYFKYYTDVSNNNIEISERYFANNCILLPAKKVKLDWLKCPGWGYIQTPCLSIGSFYTLNEYKIMLNKYANNKLSILPNILESFFYFAVYKIRVYLRKYNPKLRNIIQNILNKIAENKRKKK